jgi:mannose-6-phosphate isomerase
MEPIVFEPLYQPRVWGGRELERLYARDLPTAAQPIGESWEIVDRAAEQSIVKHGIYCGKTLHELWQDHRTAIFGADLPASARFPLLIKILDAREDLSLQVHPPLAIANELGGEPKTEMWYIAACEPQAQLYVGLKRGVTRSTFEQAIAAGTVAQQLHTLTPTIGESIFIESGRLHAIGAGFVIYEIQQNSDTTYRVFDWNRSGLDGQPRELHLAESMASIDFDDFEPAMDRPVGDRLATCAYFETHLKTLASGEIIGNPQPGRFSILAIVAGSLASEQGQHFPLGQVLLMPCGATPLRALTAAKVLQVTLPTAVDL